VAPANSSLLADCITMNRNKRAAKEFCHQPSSRRRFDSRRATGRGDFTGLPLRVGSTGRADQRADCEISEGNMTTPLTFPQALSRRNIIKGAAALATAAVSVRAASAATAPPLGQTGAPTMSTAPLPLGPLPGSRYPDSHLESAKKGPPSFGPPGFPAFAGTMAVERVATGFRWAEGPVYFADGPLRAVQRHSEQSHHALFGG